MKKSSSQLLEKYLQTTGEKLIWSAKPDDYMDKQLPSMNIFLVIFGVGLELFLGLCLFVLIRKNESYAIIGTIMLFMIVLLVAILLGVKYNKKTIYGITNHHVVVLGSIFGKKIFNIQQLKEITYTEASNGYGSLYLGPVQYADGKPTPTLINVPKVAIVYDMLLKIQAGDHVLPDTFKNHESTIAPNNLIKPSHQDHVKKVSPTAQQEVMKLWEGRPLPNHYFFKINRLSYVRILLLGGLAITMFITTYANTSQLLMSIISTVVITLFFLLAYFLFTYLRNQSKSNDYYFIADGYIHIQQSFIGNSRKAIKIRDVLQIKLEVNKDGSGSIFFLNNQDEVYRYSMNYRSKLSTLANIADAQKVYDLILRIKNEQ